jgi:hypothetical protein
MKDEDGEYIMLSAEDQIDAMIQKNLKAFNAIDKNNTFKPKTGLSKKQLFDIMDDAYPLWYTVEKNQPYFSRLTKLDPFQEQQMLRNLDQAYDIMRELEDMTENIQTRAQLLFDSYHLLSGATELSLEFLKYRQSLMNTIVRYREEVLDYIKLYPIDIAEKDIYFWAAQDEDRELEYVSMDILHTTVWDLLGMEDVPMDDKNEIGATCLFNGIQTTIDNSTDRRKFAGRVVFGDLTVRHVLFDVSGKVVSLGYIDHEHDNRDNETWSGVAHELVFVREDCTLLKKGSDVWYQDSRYTISSIGSDEHLTPRGYVNKEKLTNIRLHLQPKDTTRQIQVVITDQEVKDVDLRGHENSYGFTVDSKDRLMYKNGYVCDHLFQKKEANMICTALGYEDVLYYKTGYEIPAANAWGRPHITMTDLDCDFMARDVENCKMLTGKDMDKLQSPWTFCGTQNGVQLKCVNNWVRNKKSFRMEVESKNVSCSRNEESVGIMIDTAEKCSGGAGDQASNFGNVDKVTVKGSICVKLMQNDQLDCVVNEDSAAWDFTNTEVLKKFCYRDSLSLSGDKLTFPEHIQMISEYRKESCTDNERGLQQAELKFTNNGTRVKLEECKKGNEFGFCTWRHEDAQFEAHIKIDDSDLRTFLDLCPMTCKICTPNPRKHYNVTVNVQQSEFAVGRGEAVSVTIDDKDSKTFEYNSPDRKKFSFGKEFHCGDKIRIVAKADHGEYDHGFVTCSVQMVEGMSDARIDADGYVMVDGDIEVTFQCFNPPSMSPSTDQPSTAPSTDQPTGKPTNIPSSTPSMKPSSAPLNSAPSVSPTSSSPTKTPSSSPTKTPSSSPTKTPSSSPTKTPSFSPSKLPIQCASGYLLIPDGDVPGYGKLNGRGGGESLDSCSACADLCNAESTCKSYECDGSEKVNCNLNSTPGSTTKDCGPACQRQTFCSKQTTEACFFNERQDVTCEGLDYATGGVFPEGFAFDKSLQECEQACKNTNTCEIFGHAISADGTQWGKGFCVIVKSCDSYLDNINPVFGQIIFREKKPECSSCKDFEGSFFELKFFTDIDDFDSLTCELAGGVARAEDCTTTLGDLATEYPGSYIPMSAEGRIALDISAAELCPHIYKDVCDTCATD